MKLNSLKRLCATALAAAALSGCETTSEFFDLLSMGMDATAYELAVQCRTEYGVNGPYQVCPNATYYDTPVVYVEQPEDWD